MAESVDIMTCLDILFFVVLYFRTFILCGTERKLCIIMEYTPLISLESEAGIHISQVGTERIVLQ